ncbi:hypothetical protein OUZ56_014895 [Daphnia magna]|uniref:Uncharacterized protein n=1 Tax=Daphnia magna TaxID=35525 RepID=A0ABR0AL64_9CRUS|nr:hypothetical protein OUZ56_014895 [Daphnia magna]
MVSAVGRERSIFMNRPARGYFNHKHARVSLAQTRDICSKNLVQSKTTDVAVHDPMTLVVLSLLPQLGSYSWMMSTDKAVGTFIVSLSSDGRVRQSIGLLENGTYSQLLFYLFIYLPSCVTAVILQTSTT